MAGAYMSSDPSMADLFANDPTVDLTGDPDKANGPKPNPPLYHKNGSLSTANQCEHQLVNSA
jgi:hypothetical protein